MRANLDASLQLILRWEGGFASRLTEPGGSVNMGVSFQTFAAWRTAHGRPVPTVDDLKAMPESEAIEIYMNIYADAIAFDDLPSGLDLCVLDASINEGVGGAHRLLSAATEAFGKRSSVNAVAPVSDMIDHICDARLAGKRARPEWARFGAGWTARIESIRTHAKELA